MLPSPRKVLGPFLILMTCVHLRNAPVPLVLACGLSILTSINALAKGDQRFLPLTSSRAPGAVFEPLGSFSPVSGNSGGSISTSLDRLLQGFQRRGP